MFKPFHALFLMLAQSTHDELIRQNQYLKVENETLRSRLPKRITVTPAERSRLLKYGRLIGPAIKELISIVHPRTFARWVADEKKDPNKLPAKRGRPRTRVEIRELIFRMARENNWGYNGLTLFNLSPPSLHRRYPASSLLWGDPTSPRASAARRCLRAAYRRRLATDSWRSPGVRVSNVPRSPPPLLAWPRSDIGLRVGGHTCPGQASLHRGSLAFGTTVRLGLPSHTASRQR